MNSFLRASCWLALLLSSLAVAGEESSRAALSAQLLVDTRVLAETLRAFGEARAQEKAAQTALITAENRQDLALIQASSTPEQLQRAEQERAVAAAALAVLADRSQNLRQQLLFLAQRMAAARAELGRLAPLTGLEPDPISGRWQVAISSPPQSGIFELRLDGAQVTGTFQLDSGRSGSLSGTFAGGRLRLQRTDNQRGFDGLFDGSVDATLGTVRGFYSPADLAAGEPAGSGWSGVRQKANN